MSFAVDENGTNPQSNDENSNTHEYDNQKKISEIIEKLQESYYNPDIVNKADTFAKLLNRQDIMSILEELAKKNLEDIVVYILTEFSFSSDEKPKELLYLNLYLLSIKKGQIHILEALDNKDLNFSEMVDKDKNTGLILAVIFSDLQIAKFFLKRSPELLVKPNAMDYTPLRLAVYNNDNLMFFLLANNLMFPISSEGNLLCELAIRNENLEILTYLNPELNKVKCKFAPSKHLLHFAVCQNNIDIFNMVCKMVNEYNVQLPSSLETPLHWAVMRGNYHIIKALIGIYKEKQIELDQRNFNGVTPFYLANLRQDKYICELLFDNGANANESDNSGNSIVHMLAALGDVKWIKYAIKRFNVNCYLKNDKGDTPFIMAVLNENYAAVEFFIDLFKMTKSTMSMNLNWRNKFGQTALHAAVFTGNLEVIELLLKNKADISICDINELTPYHYAYIEEKEAVIKVIHSILGVDKNTFIK